MAIRSLSSRLGGQLRSKPPVGLSSSWTCDSCRLRTPLKAGFSSSSRALEKPFYVTTPIFYVNAAPHVGHLYTMVLADIIKRWHELQSGKKAILCTGTDEHGMKIQQAAAKANVPPKEFCDLTSKTFLSLAERVGLSNDHFVRTTDEDHKDAVQYFWHMLKEREYIYESKHEGWYCVSDETYYPESTIEKRLDPMTGKTFMASQETGKEVEWTSEVNYHFRLSIMRDRLLEFYERNPHFLTPASRMDEVINWVKAGLDDLSVSRPVERLSWGIPVPDDPSQTIYVWLDALVNYITKAGYPWAPRKQTAGGWPADVQVIGKDIVRFHCIYWPAFLLALDIAPPQQILAHAHWTMGSQKMSKSVGNVVNPIFAMDRWGVDVMRYYLAHDGGIKNDSDYGNHVISERYKKGLQGGIGNLVSRITRSKIWSIETCVKAAKDGRLLKDLERNRDQQVLLNTLAKDAHAEMIRLDPGAALRVIMTAVYETNKYLQLHAPWALAKKQQNIRKISWGDGSEVEELDVNRLKIEGIIYICAEACRIVGILLQPYMPQKAARLLDMLGVEKSQRTFEHAQLGTDFTYGKPKYPPGRHDFDSLFPPMTIDDP